MLTTTMYANPRNMLLRLCSLQVLHLLDPSPMRCLVLPLRLQGQREEVFVCATVKSFVLAERHEDRVMSLLSSAPKA
jgi:hypothetical protein